MTTEQAVRPPFLPLDGQEPAVCFGQLPSPIYILDAKQLRKNGEILASAAARSGAKILLAQKAFSNFPLYPLLAPYLAGTEASGLYEARLGREEMGGREVHVFSAAYRDDEFDALLQVADHLVFNSIAQLKKFGPRARQYGGKSLGLRINPVCSTQEGHELYDPCAPGSRLGVTRDVWDAEMTDDAWQLLDGLHFHTLCEQNADALETTLHAVDRTFGEFLPQMRWLNMGGGHHITRYDYDMDTLVRAVAFARDRWQVDVYLEPGEAVALNAGFFLCRVLDIVRNGDTNIAILDGSAACHMPDVLEMPYTPPVYGAWDAAGEGGTDTHPFRYRLAGPTCLAGDVIGDYRFRQPLSVGDCLVFGDMAIYTTCKNNTFNGMPLPAIWLREENGTCRCLKSFGYADFKQRLG